MKGVKNKTRRQTVCTYLDAIEYANIRNAAVLMNEKTSEFIRTATNQRATEINHYLRMFEKKQK